MLYSAFAFDAFMLLRFFALMPPPAGE